MHKTLQDPESSRPQLLAQADAHMSNALIVYRQLLPAPTEETAIAMFLLSSLLVTYNLVSAQIQEPDDPIGALVHCFRLLRGVRVVISGYWTKLLEVPTISLVLNSVTKLESLALSDTNRFDAVADLEALATGYEDPDREAIIGAVSSLHLTCRRTEATDNKKHVHSVWMTW